jgi:hypothetical protein
MLNAKNLKVWEKNNITLPEQFIGSPASLLKPVQ